MRVRSASAGLPDSCRYVPTSCLQCCHYSFCGAIFTKLGRAPRRRSAWRSQSSGCGALGTLPHPFVNIMRTSRMEWCVGLPIRSLRCSPSRLRAGGFVHVPMDAASKATE